MYNDDFKTLLFNCRHVYGFGDNFIIGSGNPSSRILFVGKEPTGDACKSNTLLHYENNLRDGIIDVWRRVRIQEIHDQGKIPTYWNCAQTLWSRYQKLYDYIFPEKIGNRKEVFDFEEFVFCSELNGTPSKKTHDANTSKIHERKRFFRDPFFNRFAVIVLACGEYISNQSTNPEEREIDNIFKVSFESQKGRGRYLYWAHYNSNRTRLVIHTRNLSNGIPNSMLEDMGRLIRSFLKTLQQ